jgi:hypothetical protein
VLPETLRSGPRRHLPDLETRVNASGHRSTLALDTANLVLYLTWDSLYDSTFRDDHTSQFCFAPPLATDDNIL